MPFYASRMGTSVEVMFHFFRVFTRRAMSWTRRVIAVLTTSNWEKFFDKFGVGFGVNMFPFRALSACIFQNIPVSGVEDVGQPFPFLDQF